MQKNQQGALNGNVTPLVLTDFDRTVSKCVPTDFARTDDFLAP